MDTVAEFLTRIRNASRARLEKVDVPSSSLRHGIAQALADAGYIRSFKVAKDSKQGFMRLYLKYDDTGVGSINVIQRQSRPGRRVYVSSESIPSVRSGMGLAIVSTSKGIMSGVTAKEKNLGGELLCTVW